MPTSRYTLLLDEDALRTVERLREAFGLRNKAEVYDLSVRILSWLTDQQAGGYEVGRFKNGDFHPLLLPYNVNLSSWRASSSNGAVLESP
jgi:hypothetical protein